MQQIKLKGKMSFCKVRSDQQVCVYCAKKMGVGNVGLSLRNPAGYCNKNVWIHLGCINLFGKYTNKELKKQKSLIVAISI